MKTSLAGREVAEGELDPVLVLLLHARGVKGQGHACLPSPGGTAETAGERLGTQMGPSTQLHSHLQLMLSLVIFN